MVTNACPECGKPIPAGAINISEGVALCPSCGKLSRLSDVVNEPVVDANELATPPSGCSYRQDPIGDGLVVRASLNSPGAAAGTLLFALFWNGIVSVFVLVAIAGLYTHFVGPLPKWFPFPPNGRGHNGNMGPDMPLGTTLFLCVFLIPFVAIGTGMILAFFTYLIGRIEVTVTGDDGRVRTGFGPFNWTTRFDASGVTKVLAAQSSSSQNGQYKQLIQLEADRAVKFGSMLSNRRREWMLGVLHLALVARPQAGRVSPLAHR